MQSIEKENIQKTGTTTVCIKCKDGVVLAADKRATAGTMIVNKNAPKVQFLTENVVVTMAGTVSDAQLMINLTKSELRLKQVRTNRPVLVKEAASLMSRMVYGNIRKMSMIPGVSHFLLGGIDTEGFHAYDIFPDGSISEIDDYVSSGSGSVFAYGVLESQYKKDLSVESGVKLAIKSINTALQRDSASGNGIDVFVVNKEGVKQVLSKDVSVNLEA